MDGMLSSDFGLTNLTSVELIPTGIDFDVGRGLNAHMNTTETRATPVSGQMSYDMKSEGVHLLIKSFGLVLSKVS